MTGRTGPPTPHAKTLFGFATGGCHAVNMAEDAELLRDFAATRSEAAFAEFVRRHIDAVYSAALRRMGDDQHLAEDVTQHVFAAVARKAAAVARHPAPGAWLYVTTRHEAANAVRTEQRRKRREKEAMAMQELEPPSDTPPDWRRVGPVLDASIDRLGGEDRTAILLRYVENRPFAEIGRVLQLSEDAARMRVVRALDRLQVMLKRRGIDSSAAALGLALSSELVRAAPAALPLAVTTTSVASSAATGGTTSALLQLMTTTKAGVTLATAGLLVVIGTATHQYRSHDAAELDLAAAQADNARAQARLSSAEAESRDLKRQTNEAAAKLAERMKDASLQATMRPPSRGSADPKDPLTAGAAFLTAHPEVRSALARFVDSQTDAQFGALYRELKMGPAEIDRFRELMREISGYGQYIGSSSQLVQFSLNTGVEQTDVWNQVRAVLGDTRFRRAMEYLSDQPARLLTESVTGAFVFSEPLTSDQIQSLHQIVREAQTAGRPDRIDWGRLTAAAAGFLSPQQLTILNGVRAQKEYYQSVAQAATDRQSSTR
jgi:RNA polymerase sigma factor (sigma-70 family)